MKKQVFTLLLALSVTTVSLGQSKSIYTSREYPKNYFRNPLNIKPDASGTFGELRSTHFHAGDDYRTQQRIGLPLYAAADGYVSRIRVQIGGGGNSVYITHPNGYTTVYLHMDHFNDALTNIVRAEQHQRQRFDVEIELKKDQIKLSKGEQFGNTGNTGGSAGPHLHFEIRDTKTERPLNPQLFGLLFTDNYAPTINGIMVYDLNEQIFNEFTGRRYQQLRALGNGRYALASKSPIQVNGKFGLGINTIDRHRAGGFQNGVYSIDLFLDGHPVSTTVFEELDFNTSRAIHSYIDYPYWKKTRVKVQKSFKDPGNPIEIFKHLENEGVIQLQDNKVHDIKYVVKDVKGNCSELNFQIVNSANYKPKNNPVKGNLFHFDKPNKFTADNIQIEIPTGVLYSDLDFIYSQSETPKNGYSHLHRVQNNQIPLFSTYILSIKPSNLPTHLESKAIIASLESGAEGGTFEKGWVSVNTRNFGSFYVAVDTIAPTITPRNISSGKNLSNQSKIDFTIADNFSGIQSFNGYIDDKWVLMEYDSKNKHLWHKFDSGIPKGKHKFKLVVKDWKDNQKVYTATFTK